MKVIPGVFLGSALILASVGVALGQQADPSVSGTTSSNSNSTGTVDVKGPVDAQGNMQTAAGTDAAANTDASLDPIRERAKKASAKTCAVIQKQLAQISRQIDAEANEKGDVVVAGRMAPEFGMAPEAMTAEQSQFGTGMGEITIAHTLMANSKTTVTCEQLFQLHKEGLGWAQIAHGLNLRLGDLNAAMNSEMNVASGRVKADGKVAMIHSDTRVASSTRAAGKAGVQAGSTGVGSASSAGVGLKVGN
jgi:hypothetical protein